MPYFSLSMAELSLRRFLAVTVLRKLASQSIDGV
jgi:hypothetical protein